MLNVIENLIKAAASMPGEKALVMSFNFYLTISTKFFNTPESADDFLQSTFDHIAIILKLRPEEAYILTKTSYERVKDKHPMKKKTGMPKECSLQRAMLTLMSMRKILVDGKKNSDMIGALDVAIIALARQIKEEPERGGLS